MNHFEAWHALRKACNDLDIVWSEEVVERDGPNGIQCLYCMETECHTESGDDYWHAADCPWIAYRRALTDVREL